MDKLTQLRDIVGRLDEQDIVALLTAAEAMMKNDSSRPSSDELAWAGQGVSGFIKAVKSYRNRTGSGLGESARLFEGLGFKRP